MILEQIGNLSPSSLDLVTVLTGEDTGLFQLAKAELLKQVGYDSQDLGYSFFDMAEASFEEINLDLQSLPFLAEQKVVILDNLADITTAKKRYWTDEALKQFEAYLEAPNDTVRLLLLAPGKLDSKRRLVKLLKRDARVFEASPLKEQELRHYARVEAERMGLSIASPVLEQVLQKSQFEIAMVHQNLHLLGAYKADKCILAEDIARALPKTLQDNLFDLSQYILTKQVDQARSLVQDLRLQGEEEIKLIAVLISQFRLYLQVKLLAKQGLSESHIVAELSHLLGRKINPFQVKYALRDSRKTSIAQLTSILQVLIDSDFQIKRGELDKADVLEIALLKLLGRNN